MNLSYTADTDNGLPTLLMVHGLLASRRLWEPNEALAQSFRRIRVDLPAHGASPAPVSSEAARPNMIAKQLDELRQKLGIRRWHLCGQSFGAGIVLRYALDFPEYLGGVVFTNANAALRESWSLEAKQANAARISDLTKYGSEALRNLPYHPAHARRFPQDLREALVRDLETCDPLGFALLLRESLPRLSVHDSLQKLNAPMMLINGMRERKFQPHRNWLANAYPQVQIIDLDGGHSVSVECAKEFDKISYEFLMDVPL